jgi:rhodanese-related sulfurtransferase
VGRLTRRYHIPSAIRPSSFRVEPEAARTMVADGAVLVDVRRQDDPASSLVGAVRIPPDVIPQRVGAFRRDLPIVLACT